MTAPCLYCRADTSNGLMLCARCRTTVKVGLDNLASYHADLLGLGRNRTEVRRRGSGWADPTGAAAFRPRQSNPDDPDEAAATAKTELVSWVRILLEEDASLRTPPDTVVGLVQFLTRHMRRVAAAEWAGEFARSVLATERQLRRIVERGRGRWFAGSCWAVLRPERPHDGTSCGCGCHNAPGLPCDVPGGCGLEFGVVEAELCERELYAVPGTAWVRCPDCGTNHRVSERRAILLEQARDSLLPVATIAHVCATLLDDEPSVERLRKRVQKWTERGDLVWVANDGGTRLYRVGDVLDLLTRHAADPRGWSTRRTTC